METMRASLSSDDENVDMHGLKEDCKKVPTGPASSGPWRGKKDPARFASGQAWTYGRNYQSFSQATTTASLPAMLSLSNTRDSLPSIATKDSLPYIATKDSLPPMTGTRDSFPPMHYVKDGWPSNTATSVSASEDVSESEHEAMPGGADKNVCTGEEESTETADETSSSEARSSLTDAKEAWRRRREAKKAQRKAAGRPCYGELLRKKQLEKKDAAKNPRPTSPGVKRRSSHQQQVEAMAEAPRLIDTSEALPTIMSVSIGASEITSVQGSILGSKVGSDFGSESNSRLHSRSHSRCHSRPNSRHPTLDTLPDFNEVMTLRTMARTTTRDSLPPIGDDSDIDSNSDDGENTTKVSSKSSEESGNEADESGCEFFSNSRALTQSLAAARAEIAVLAKEMEELAWNKERLERANIVLKVLATGEACAGAS